jgi:hypothetical protein
MVQPIYSPEEALQRIKLMMEYDSSKTYTENKVIVENKEVIKEQYEAPTVASGLAGAGIGAGLAKAGALGTATAAGVAGKGAVGALTGVLSVSAPAAGAIIGGAAALAVLPLVYWLVTKDTGMNKVKKMFEMCSTESAKIAKLPRKLQDTDLRSISDDIEDAVNYQTLGFLAGTDEEKLFSAFKQLESGTASDFCALIQYYNKNSESGDLFDDLDSDIDAESEWRQIFRPIRNCVEDSLLTIKDEGATTDDTKPTTGGGYKDCAGSYSYGCKSEAIRKVQGCLGGLVTDGKFGPNTRDALKAKGFDSFTDAEVDKICGKTTEEEPEISGEEQRISGNSEF